MATRDTTASSHGAISALGLEAPSARIGERLIVGALFVCGLISVLTTFGIVASLFGPTVQFFRDVSPLEFFSTGPWAPAFADAGFGVLPIVVGTLNATTWAILISVPCGLGAAIYMSEYASPRVRKVLKPALEVLEGIPTVAYGFFALTFVTPILRDIWPGTLFGGPPGIFSAGAAGAVLGIMIIPTVASISEDAMTAVPRALREGAYAMGATRMQVATRIVVPAALSGIVASFVLGVSRAVGETMIVLIAAGAMPNLTMSPAEQIQTMTAFIAGTATGDIPQGTTIYNTIFAVGALLFTMTFIMNMVSIRLVNRYRQVYE
jgi:phosphate transport system permease protein